MKTLRSLSLDQALSMDTLEGYCAWEIAQHLLYCKYLVASSLRATADTEPYPYVKKDFGGLPLDLSQKAWESFLDYLEKTHTTVMRALRSLDKAGLEQIMPEWKLPYGQLIAWLFTHDAYHSAQIRNMGVPGLKEPKYAP